MQISISVLFLVSTIFGQGEGATGTGMLCCIVGCSGWGHAYTTQSSDVRCMKRGRRCGGFYTMASSYKMSIRVSIFNNLYISWSSERGSWCQQGEGGLAKVSADNLGILEVGAYYAYFRTVIPPFRPTNCHFVFKWLIFTKNKHNAQLQRADPGTKVTG